MTIINEGGKNKLKHKILQEEGEAGLKKISNGEPTL
jgi:hypothetical protein